MRAPLLPVLFLTVLVAPAGGAAPEVTITGPSTGAYINAGDPDPYPVTAAVAAGEATSVEFFRCNDATPGCLGGTWVSFGVVPAPGPYTASLPLDADGNRALKAVATDPSGPGESLVVNVLIDRTAPAGGLTAPANGAFVAGNENITANPTDEGSGTASVVFQRSPAGSQAWTTIATDVAAPWSTQWNTTAQPDGAVGLRTVVADAAGNAAASAVRTVTVDNTQPAPPKLTLSESSPYAAVSGNEVFVNTAQAGNFAIAAESNDPTSGVAKVRFPAGIEDSTPPFGTSYAFDDLAGVQVVTAFDNAGNTASSAFEVTPDTAGPIGGSISYPAYALGGRVAVTIKNGVDLSGLDVTSGALERDRAALVGTACAPFAGAWARVSNPDALPPNTCARYRYRISDRVGNQSVYTSSAVVRFDTAPPAGVKQASATAGNHVVTLRWTRPTDADFAGVQILRTRPGSGAVQVYFGADTTFKDTSLTNGVRYTYELRSRDGSGNQSNVLALVATPRSPYLRTPKDGAFVRRAPLLDWRRKTRATYYNVQLFRNGVKILSRHPTLSHFRLTSRWTYKGRVYRLTAGHYRWYVWPGFGRQSAVRYGKLLGWSEFKKRS